VRKMREVGNTAFSKKERQVSMYIISNLGSTSGLQTVEDQMRQLTGFVPHMIYTCIIYIVQ
jgi:hypothetical protein